MKRIQEQEKGPREKKVEPKPVAPAQPVQVKSTAVQPVRRPTAAARQQSEDDEIAKIKRENKTAGTSTTPTVPEVPTQSILKKSPPSTDESPPEVSQVLFTQPCVKASFSSLFVSNVYDLFVLSFFQLFLSLADKFRQHQRERRQQQRVQAARVRQRVQVTQRQELLLSRRKLHRLDHV